MTEIKAGMLMWSSVFEKNVEIVRVYKDTATIRVSVGGIKSGELMTFRGQQFDTLSQRRQRSA